MKVKLLVVVFGMFLLNGTTVFAELDPLVNYDNFNAKKYNGCKYCINSEKWRGLQRGNYTTELSRAIKSKKARLTLRSWGRTDADVGTEQGRNRINFRDSVDFSGVCFTPRVKKYDIKNCAANGAASSVRVRYVGNFFDADDEVNDGEIGNVYGWFHMRRQSETTDKKGIFEVQGFASECLDTDCELDNWSTYDDQLVPNGNDPDLFFGTVKASKNKKEMCIGYDRMSHELVFSFGNDVRTVNSGVHGLPLFESDVPSGVTWHVIETRADVENCTAGAVSGYIDADVDNVKVREFQ